MDPSPDIAITRAIAALTAHQQDDGSWPGTNFAGPMYTAMTLVVERRLGVLDEQEAREAIRWMCTTQFDDGSFPSFPFADQGELGATGMAYAGMIAAGGGELAPENVRKARAFLDSQGGLGTDGKLDPQTRMYLCLAGLVDPATLDKPSLLFKLVPGVDRMLGRRFGLAMVLIANQNSMIVRGLQLGAGRTNPWLHPLRALENKRVLQYLTSHQNPEGNWAGVIMPTLAGILCLHFLGIPNSDPRVRNALGYLNKWKVSRSAGLEVMPTLGVIWNTALITRVLIMAGMQDNGKAIDRGLDYLLRHQSDTPMPEDWQNPDPGQPRTGGWNYYSDNKLCCDADTTGAVLWTLGLALETGAMSREKGLDAARRGLAWELGMQNADGGWPAFAHGQRSKPAGPMYEEPMKFPKPSVVTMIKLFLNPPAALADPATAGLTGRAICGLAYMGKRADSVEIRRAIEFLKSEQWAENGVWWGRWEVNFLMGSGCVLSGLKAVGEDMNSSYIRTAVEWILSRQNEDGGWGESLESYSDPGGKAGIGPSRSIITSAVVSALIDAGEGRNPAVQQGVEYILSTQGGDGLWDEEQCFYVILPPIYYYTNYFYSQYFPVEALIKYRSEVVASDQPGSAH